jgi:hypothetical protein
MLGKYGLDIDDHSTLHVLRSLPGAFTALNLVCITYAGFNEMAKEADAGGLWAYDAERIISRWSQVLGE